MTKFIQAFLRDEDGVTAIEYGLLAAGIAVVVATAAASLGNGIGGLLDSITNYITGKVVTG